MTGSTVVSWITLGALLFSSAAQASVQVEEVQDTQPEVAQQLARQAAAVQYAAATQAGVESPQLVLGTNVLQPESIVAPLPVTTALIIIDQIINLGQTIWNIIAKGKPVANITQNVADAVPKGVTSWEQLAGWSNPVTKLYHTTIDTGAGEKTGDFYFRLLFTPGGNYNGAGKYLTGVTIMPADLTVTYDHTLTMTTTVVDIMNQGTAEQPIAGMTLQLKWSMDTLFTHNEQALSFHVRGDGDVEVLATPTEQATSVTAPSVTPPVIINFPPNWEDPGIDDGIGAG